MKFLDMEGYIWVFSRADHTSVGIGAKLGAVSGNSLFKLLDDFLDENYPGIRKKRKYSALIPTATDEHFFDLPCCGDNWLLVGDAAGHVDPIAGEGIYYALGSAKMASLAILSDDIRSYDKLWKDKYGEILKQGASFRKAISKLAQNFDSEIIGAMMFAQGL